MDAALQNPGHNGGIFLLIAIGDNKYISSFYLVGAIDCKRYLTGPKDLLDNYTDPTDQPDNYAGSKASKNL